MSGQRNGDINQWQCNGRDAKLYSYKKTAHNSNVDSIFYLNNILFSGDKEGNIKFWELK